MLPQCSGPPPLPSSGGEHLKWGDVLPLFLRLLLLGGDISISGCFTALPRPSLPHSLIFHTVTAAAAAAASESSCYCPLCCRKTGFFFFFCRAGPGLPLFLINPSPARLPLFPSPILSAAPFPSSSSPIFVLPRPGGIVPRSLRV